jgi:poly(3-hydroxybutyrate) depolymerase
MTGRLNPAGVLHHVHHLTQGVAGSGPRRGSKEKSGRWGCALQEEQGKKGASDHEGDERHVKVGRLEREYVVHLPRGWDGRRPLTVVLNFHGGGVLTDDVDANDMMWKFFERHSRGGVR